ncbi:MAG: hypothetical protein IT212_05980 [Bacteroidia bacterium]|nr:hypothetical protein [Bacteroidia bacterium]
MKKEEIIEKLKAGIKLFMYKRFRTSGNSFTSKVLPGDVITFEFADRTKVHHTTGKSLLKNGLVTRGSSEKTLGGTKVELIFVPESI